MRKVKHIGVCGGDARQKYLAEALFESGYSVSTWGLSALSSESGIPALPMETLLGQCDCLIFPLPATVDGKTLFAPHSKEMLPIDGGFAKALRGKLVFAGLKDRLIQADPQWETVGCLDYSKEESFAIRNAFPTVEGALALAIQSSDRALRGSRCLVTGFGRIGQVLCRSLADLGASVSAAARKPDVLTWIGCQGYRPVSFSQLAAKKQLDYDFIFNTVPAMVFPAELLARMGKDCVAIELASAPGGFDFAAGERLSRTIVKAPSLPGRFSPRTAGEIIKDTILTMLEE